MMTLGVPGCECRKCGPINKGDTIKLDASGRGNKNTRNTDQSYHNIWVSNYSITTNKKNIFGINIRSTNIHVIKVNSSTIDVDKVGEGSVVLQQESLKRQDQEVMKNALDKNQGSSTKASTTPACTTAMKSDNLTKNLKESKQFPGGVKKNEVNQVGKSVQVSTPTSTSPTMIGTPHVEMETGAITKKYANTAPVNVNIQQNDAQNNLYTGDLKVEEGIEVMATIIETKKNIGSNAVIKDTATVINMATEANLFNEETQETNHTLNVNSGAFSCSKDKHVVADCSKACIDEDQANKINSSSIFKTSTTNNTKKRFRFFTALKKATTRIELGSPTSPKDIQSVSITTNPIDNKVRIKENSLQLNEQNINQELNKISNGISAPQQQCRDTARADFIDIIEKEVIEVIDSKINNEPASKIRQDSLNEPALIFAISSTLSEEQEGIGGIKLTTEMKKEETTQVNSISKNSSTNQIVSSMSSLEGDQNNINQNVNKNNLPQQLTMGAKFPSFKYNTCVIIVFLLCACISYLIVWFLFNVL